MESAIIILMTLGLAYLSNFKGFKDYVHSKTVETPKQEEIPQPVETPMETPKQDDAVKPIETPVETPKPVDTAEQDKKDAEKFAKEFTVDQFIKFAGQLQSIIEITKLLKGGDVKGVFERYIKPMDWANFIKEVYSNSAKFNITLIQSLGKTAAAKIVGLNIEQVEYYFAALKDEYWSIKKGNEAVANIMLLKSTGVLELNDHNQAVAQGFHLLTAVSQEMEFNDDIENNFKDFIIEQMPELHLQLDISNLQDFSH